MSIARAALAAVMAGAIAAGVAGAAPASAAGAIAIVINGNPLPLQPPPRFEGSVLLVPVRRTLEALGLGFERSGNAVRTQVGSKQVELEIGSRNAHVDGANVELDAPVVERDGVLYAPLRFFTDVLGAQARYDKPSNTVKIVAQLVGRTELGMTQSRDQIVRFGNVAAVDVLSNPPTLTLGYDSSVKVIPIGNNAIVEMQDVNADVVTPGELGDVRPGDFARVEMHKNGSVERVVDAFGSRIGTIVAVAGNQFVLDDGHVIGWGRSTEVSLNGKAASFGDLRPGDNVSVRYNVESGEVREVLASRVLAAVPAPSGGPAISSVHVAEGHPLRAGETLDVDLRGTPGGSATFDIGSYVTNQAMHEQSPGLYAGSYTIPRGASFAGAPVIGHLSIGMANAPDVAAAESVWASGTPPGIGDFAPDAGATVNTNRPAVYATFQGGAVGVNASSAGMWVDGRDVSSECVRTPQFIQYFPSYSYHDGPVHVTVRVADRAGNTTTKSWSFTIRTRP